MKKCSCCGIEKLDSDFFKNKRHRDGLQSRCKICHKLSKKEHYESNKDRYVAKAAEYKNKITEKLRTIKRENGCSLCNEYEPVALDFHHKDSALKEFCVSKAPERSWRSVVEEIAKCIILCKNCHAKVHAGIMRL